MLVLHDVVKHPIQFLKLENYSYETPKKTTQNLSETFDRTSDIRFQ